MKLSYVFEQLMYGELAMVAMAGNEDQDVKEKNYRALGSHVEMGLTALYKRFNLKYGEITVKLVPDIFVYPLQSKYAVNEKRSTEVVRFIMDTVTNPYKDDILKILSVSTDKKCEFPMNNYTNDYSLFTPTMDTLRVPEDVVTNTTMTPEHYRTQTLRVKYQADHPRFMPSIQQSFFDPELTNIELPDAHLQALLYFVASRVNNPIGMGQEFNAGNNWAAKYEQECLRLEFDGNEINDSATQDRARRNGWV